MKNLLEIIRKNIFSITVGAVTIDQWKMAKQDHLSKNTTAAKNSTLENKLELASTKITNLQAKVNKLEGENADLNKKISQYENSAREMDHNLTNHKSRIEQLEQKAQSSTLTESQKSEILNEYNGIKSDQVKAVDNLNKDLDLFESELDTFVKPSEKNILSFYHDLKETYVDFIGQLSLEELAILSNLVGLFTILLALISISSIMFGEYLVKFFKLEHKFPKFSKYLQMRAKLNRTALIINFIYIYLVIIVFIFINFYMFLC